MANFKAVVCEKLGSISNLILKTMDNRELPDGHARIRVLAAGINFPDKLMVEGKYQFSPPVPFTPGMEVAGEIIEISNNPEFQVGCKVICSLRYGGYSQEIIAPIRSLVLTPKDFSPEQAAGFKIAAQTAFVALVERAKALKHETIMVTGAAGGVGSAAIQLGKAIGAHVIAVSSSKEKQNYCRNLGAEHSISYHNLKTKIMDITNGDGVDIIFDPVGGNSFRNFLSCIKWGGRYLVVGFAAGNIPVLPVNIALIKGISLMGVRAGEYYRRFPEKEEQSTAKILKMANSMLMTPSIYKTLPLANAVDALKMIENKEVMGRIILVPN